MKTLRTAGVVVIALAAIAWTALGVSLAGAATNQNTFDGSCSLHGTATFDAPYLKGAPDDVTYHFKTSTPPPGANPNTCTGSLNGGDDNEYPVSAYVDGTGQLSCASSSGTGGKGAVTISAGGKSYVFPATLDINGAGTEVVLNIHDSNGGQAYGHASFAKYSTADTPADCNGDGVKSLQFDADFSSTEPFKADAPTATASSPSSGGTPQTSGGGGGDAGSTPDGSQTQTTQGQFEAQPQSQGEVKGERKSSPKKKKAKKKSRGLKCGKGHKKHTKAQGKRCAKRGKGKKKGHSK